MIERAAKMADWLRGTYGFSPEMNAKCVQLLKDMAGEMERLRAERGAAQWISVEERLPETDNYCIVFEPGYGCEVCMYYGDGEWLTPDLSNVTRFVSHWMPLPEAPKEEQHEK